MMCGITGTPGTGKSSITRALEERGHRVVHLSDTVGPYILERDEARDTFVIDEERWAAEFPRVEGFVEGHLAHLLPCDLVIVLRCRPDVLESRLEKRGYSREKVRENVEAEALDVILIEAVEERGGDRVQELDTTALSPHEAADIIERILNGELKLGYGRIDWSDYLLGGST